jgi:hypothetical protein
MDNFKVFGKAVTYESHEHPWLNSKLDRSDHTR